jgi:hypothetical protein
LLRTEAPQPEASTCSGTPSATSLGDFSPAECAHYLAYAGYVPSNREPL